MATIQTKSEIVTTIDAEGNEQTTTKESTSKIERSSEPDYIKLYTQTWCEFNGIPDKWRELFLQLALRMSYASAVNPTGGQTVTVYGMTSDALAAACGWKNKRTLRSGLKALCDCGAIRNVGRAVYQINPEYAGRGEWKYNPHLQRGGVEDLVATFKISKDGGRHSSVSITWADDGQDTAYNRQWREGLGVKNDGTILKTRSTSAPEPADGGREAAV